MDESWQPGILDTNNDVLIKIKDFTNNQEQSVDSIVSGAAYVVTGAKDPLKFIAVPIEIVKGGILSNQ